MWSGPRNISTAMMRSWGARPDCGVSDEPLYGHYLSWLSPHRRSEHPAADEVIAAMDCDWRSVAATLTGPVPGGKPIWYQKHMAHHLTPDMDLGWVERLTNCFLIRDPAAMITSFIKVIPNPTPEDLGLPQQVALFERIQTATGRTPPVVDSADVLRDPRSTLSGLCDSLGVPFDDAMLAWRPGSPARRRRVGTTLVLPVSINPLDSPPHPPSTILCRPDSKACLMSAMHCTPP
jgi:hypothetical protein